MKRLYEITITLSGKNKAPSRPVKDKNSKTITDEAKERARWAEHFQEILNRPPPQVPPDIPPAANPLGVNTNPPTKAEVNKLQSYQVLEVRQYNRPRPHSTRSTKGGSPTSKDDPPTSDEDLRQRADPREMERRVPDETAEERGPVIMQQLVGNHAALHPKQDPDKNHPGETQKGPGQNSKRGAGRFLPKQILDRPHRHAADHHRAVAGMADPSELSIGRLPKGIRWRGSRHHLEAHATLRLPPPQVHFHHTTFVRQLQLRSHTRRDVDGHINCRYRPVFIKAAYCRRPNSFW